MEEQQNEALEQRQNCCCLTGHRSLPSDPDRLAELRQNLRRLICDLAQQDITTFKQCPYWKGRKVKSADDEVLPEGPILYLGPAGTECVDPVC